MSHLVKKIRFMLICVLLVAASSVCITLTYLASKNSLYENGNWVPYKTLIKRIPEEAFHFLFSRVTLNQNQLDMASWRGFHEVSSRQAFDDIYQVAFSVKCNVENSWFAFFIADKEGNYTGIRMHDKAHRSMFFKANPKGEFVERFFVEKQEYSLEGSGTLDCIATFVDGKMIFSINSDRIGMIFIDDMKKPFKFGFGGGYKPLVIDDVVVKNSEHKVIFSDDFSNKHDFFKVLGISFIFVLFAVFVGVKQRVFAVETILERCGRWVSGRFVRNLFSALGGSAYVRVFVMSCIIACLCAAVLLVDHYAMIFNVHRTRGWNPLAPLMEKTFGRKKIGDTPFLKEVLERETEYIKSYQNRAIISDVYARFENQPKKDLRIMFFGGSPTFGEGVNSREETFPEIAGRALSEKTGLEVDVINLALVDATTDLILEKYQNEWIKFKPDLVLVNLCSGRNETPENFVDNLTKLIEFNRAKGIETIILLEPHSSEKYDRGRHSYHEVNEFVARSTDTQVIDLVKFMNLAEDIGFVWLDEVHLRPYGHESLGEYLAERVLAKTAIKKLKQTP